MLHKIRDYIRMLYEVYCREFKLVLSDMGIIIFLGLLPSAYPIIYSLIYNPELVREVKIVAVDHDRTPLSRELARNLNASQEVAIIGYASDLSEGRRAMNEHEVYGILEIPEGFERKVRSGEVGNAVIYSEMSLLLRYRAMLVAATNVGQAMSAEIQTEDIDRVLPLAETVAVGDPMQTVNVTMGNIESGFDSFIMPGIVVLILQQCLVLAIGMAGGAKRENPLLTGYNAVNEMPSVLMTMLGQVLCYFTVITLPTIFLLHYVALIFSFPMAGSIWQIFTFIMPMVLASILLGMAVQAVVWERESIFVLWVVTSVVFLFLSGLTWPRYGMSGFWKVLSDCVPATWGVQGFIRMNSNGASLAQVRPDYINLWWCVAGYGVLAYVLQRWVVRPSVFRRQKAQ
ncbi:MAG: ABC transporter permease [Muribaculaceae bacterium]|nr:ABC transporter permease [Muribaculaceae bacterium]